MTSPDGITWTSRTSAADNNWREVTYGFNIFVAVAASGTGDRVMTSPDGITWTVGASAADNPWESVTYSNGLFVAVAIGGSVDRVMTSYTLSSTPVLIDRETEFRQLILKIKPAQSVGYLFVDFP
jgi:hypothetical protein